MLSAKIKIENKLPQLYVNDKREAPMMFFSNTEIGKDEVCEKQIKMAAEHDIHMFSVCSHLPVWQKSGKRDYSSALKALDLAINTDPQAKILLRLNLSIYGNLAQEWEKHYPGDSMKFIVDCEDLDDGTNPNYGGTAVTLSSENWIFAAKEALEEFNDIVKSDSRYNDHLLGYHISAGETGEWFHCSLRERGIDFSETNRKHFRSYLENRYKTINELCDAWELKRNTYTSFDEIQIPSDIEGNDRATPPKRTLFMKIGDQRFVDYCDYSSEIVADRILDLASHARKITNCDKLIVFFYGYYFDLYDARTGHFRVERVLNSPDIDAFSSPICYTDRNEGGVGALMSAANSFTRAGKLWLVENDLRTCLCLRDDDLYDWVPQIGSIEKLIQVYRREFSQMITFNLGCWYMDLLGRGWQYHPDIWEEISFLKNKYLELNHELFFKNPDVAVIVDEKAMSYIAHAEALGINLIYKQRLEFYRAGVTFGFYNSSDFENSMINPKLAVYLNPFNISNEQCEKIQQKISVGKSSILFMHGFGLTSAENIKKLCGFEVKSMNNKMYNLSSKPETAFDITEENLMSPTIGDKAKSGGNQKSNPAYYVEENKFDGIILAKYKHDDLKGKISIAYKQNEHSKVFFAGPMCLKSDAIREICKLTGVNIYSSSNDTFIGNGNLLCLHTKENGLKTLKLPEKKTLKEIFSGEIFRQTDIIEFNANKNSTYTFIRE